MFVKNACRWHRAANYHTRIRGEFGASPFMGSFQESKGPDRARKLHRYRINAYVRSEPKTV
jgi:hypothetical protein